MPSTLLVIIFFYNGAKWDLATFMSKPISWAPRATIMILFNKSTTKTTKYHTLGWLDKNVNKCTFLKCNHHMSLKMIRIR